ncbi:MAG: hypothetical protein JRI68_32580 [Deltaproteobacteria bacterium]|nr:hypothetical protein [Deltaproteobacteria bacterium]
MGGAPLWLGLIAGAATAALVAVTGCDGEPEGHIVQPPADAGVDAPSDAATDAGPIPGPCPAGELELPAGGCQPAGIPPEACGEGFSPTGDGACDPVLPAAPCDPGLMAIPGETECRPVAPCGSGTWGDIPTDSTTEHVDAAYGGSSSDGSATDPWPTIQEAVDAAEPGAIVAVAAGSYGEDVWIMTKPVRLWGKCPGEVEVVGSNVILPAIYILEATGAEVRDLAVTGTGQGIGVHDSQDVTVDRVWIHDTPEGGLDMASTGDDTSCLVGRSLIEAVGTAGAHAKWGAELTIEATVIRDTQPGPTLLWGGGVLVLSSTSDAQRCTLEVRRSVIEGNHREGIRAFGSHVTIDETVVRDTQPGPDDLADGMGIIVGPAVNDELVTTFALLRSVVANNYTCGVCTSNADATVEATVVRNTQPRAADGTGGLGLAALSDLPAGGSRPQVAVLSSVVEQSHSVGLALAGVDATMKAVIVRDTEPELAGSRFGRGLAAELNPTTDEPTILELAGSVIERSHEVGLALIGSTATIDTTVVRDTRPRPDADLYGRGVIVQIAAETLARSQASMTHCLIEGSHESGLYVSGSDVTIEDSVIRQSQAQVDTGLFGDGAIAAAMKIFGTLHSASLRLDRCLIEDSARAAVATFGATIELGGSRLECNPIDLNGEIVFDEPFGLSDLGGNLCGCDGQAASCQVLSSGLSAPEPM